METMDRLMLQKTTKVSGTFFIIGGGGLSVGLTVKSTLLICIL